MRRHQINPKGMEIFILSTSFLNITQIFLLIVFSSLLYTGFTFTFQSILPILTRFDLMIFEKTDFFLYIGDYYIEKYFLITEFLLHFKIAIIPYILLMVIPLFGSLSIPYHYLKGWKFTLSSVILFIFSMILTSFLKNMISIFLSFNIWILSSSFFLTFYASKILFTLIHNSFVDTIIICHHCNFENPQKAKYCSQCGKSINWN